MYLFVVLCIALLVYVCILISMKEVTLKAGDFVEAWQVVEDCVGAPIRRSFGVLLEIDDCGSGLLAYKVGMGSGFFEWFCHCKLSCWTPEQMKLAVLIGEKSEIRI